MKLKSLIISFVYIMIGFMLGLFYPHISCFFLEMPYRIVVFWIFASIFAIALFLLALSEDSKNLYIDPTTHETITQIKKTAKEMEVGWCKSVSAISFALVTGCVLYKFHVFPKECKYNIETPILIIGITSCVSILWSSLFYLSELFSETWIYQPKHIAHRWLNRLNTKLSPWWHMVTFLSCIIQFATTAYILVYLYE